jgi:hypothetical protein
MAAAVLARASQAVSGLGLALEACPKDAPMVSIGGDVVVWARESLTVFGENLRRGRWTSCPCGDRCEPEEMAAALLRAVQKDLQLLAGRH